MQTININKHCCLSGPLKLNWKKRWVKRSEKSGSEVRGVTSLKADEEMQPTCGAGGSIKPGVERSGTPG
jgi:hypothetical protein